MDSLTQTLLGAAIGEAGFRGRLGGKAVWFGAACALAPDLDMVIGVAGEWAALVHHRGVTHSLIVLAALAPLAGWLGWRWTGRSPPERRGTWLQWTHLALWALLTHPVLDLFTSYGTHMLAPFSWRRFAIDGVAIVDLFYSLPLAAAAVLAWLAARGRVSAAFSRRFAAGALAATTAYLVLGLGMSRRAEALASVQLDREGFAAEEVRAMPTMFNIALWRVVARDGAGRIRAGAVSVIAPRWIDFREFALSDDPLVTKALASERGGLFRWFAQGMLSASVERRDASGVVVELADRRYGFLTAPDFTPFSALAEFDAAGELVEVRLARRLRDIAPGAELAAMWRLAWGGASEPETPAVPEALTGARGGLASF